MGALRFDGVNDTVTIPSLTLATNCVQEIKFVHRSALNDRFLFAGFTSGNANRWYVGTFSNRVALRLGGTYLYSGAGNPLLVDGVEYTITLIKIGSAWQLLLDGVSLVAPTVTFTPQPLTRIGSDNTPTFFAKMDFSYFSYVDSNDAANNRYYDPNLSGGTGSILPTTDGTNQGSLVNFPTDDSQWIGFGGETITATIAAGLPVPTAAAESTVSVPVFTSTISAGLPVPITAVVSEVSAPVFTAVISAGIPVPTASAGATILGSVTATVSAGLPVPSASASASSSVPVYTATISVGLPIPTASVVAVNAGTNNTAQVLAGLPVPAASASVTVSAPVFTANISAGLPVPAASVLASPNVVNSAVIAAGIPIPAASVSAVSVLPIYQAAISAGLPVPSASVIAISGQRQVTILPEAQASVAFESTIVAVDFQSRSAALSNQSRLVAL